MPVVGIAGPSAKGFFWAGPLKECSEAFDHITVKAVRVVDGALRVAFSVTLVKQTETVADTMNALKEVLPTVDFDPEVDGDLVYQINRPRVGRLGHKLNRLGRWETIKTSFLSITTGVAMPLPTPAFAARVYADISTDENNTVLISEPVLSDVVAELQSEAFEIAVKGDTK